MTLNGHLRPSPSRAPAEWRALCVVPTQGSRTRGGAGLVEARVAGAERLHPAVQRSVVAIAWVASAPDPAWGRLIA